MSLITFNLTINGASSEQLSAINSRLDTIMTELETLQAAVAAEDTVIASAITLLEGLKTRLDEAIASSNPAALRALSDDIGAQTTALANAIQTNTPAETQP